MKNKYLTLALLLVLSCSACGQTQESPPPSETVVPAEAVQPDTSGTYSEFTRLPVGDIYRFGGTLSEDDAMSIAQDYWDIAPGDADETTGYVYSILYQGLETRDDKIYHCFVLTWLVTEEDGFSHASTLDNLYIDAQTGECASTLS